jgi:hypothetical protein
MRKSNEQSLKDIISGMMEGTVIQSKMIEMDIINKWPELVGDMIAGQTQKMYFGKGKLFIHIESAPLRNELNFSRSKIVEIVNQFAQQELISDVVVLGNKE